MPFPDVRRLVKERPKTAPEIVSKAVGALISLDGAFREKALDNALERVAKYLGYMKFWLFGDEGHEPTKDAVITLACEVVKTNFLLLLVQRISLLGFELRKDAAQVFGAVVRIKDQHDECPGAIYVQHHSEILDLLFEGYEDANIALNCGSMFRDCVRDDTLASYVLNGPTFMEFFDKVEVANFEIASDAFASFKDLLTRHKQLVATFLDAHFKEFFDHYDQLLRSGNYVTRRQSLKLLSELLMDLRNVGVMMNYVRDVRHLMMLMNLLKDPSRSIQYEAFHVFKVFVVNPTKPQPIVDILAANRDKLLKYLEEFHKDRDDDEVFKEEKAVIIREISMLGSPRTSSTGGGSNNGSAGSAGSTGGGGAPPLAQQHQQEEQQQEQQQQQQQQQERQQERPQEQQQRQQQELPPELPMQASPPQELDVAQSAEPAGETPAS